MKKLLFLFICVLSGCGVSKQLAKDCGGDLEMGCRMIFGDSTQEESIENDVNKIKQQIAILQNNMNININQINVLTNQNQLLFSTLETQEIILTSLTDQGLLQTAQIVSIQNTINSLTTSLNTNSLSISTLQGSLVLMQGQLANLLSQDTVVEYIDCAKNGVVDGPGYDEVIMRTKSGKLIAYFESNNNGFLSVLVSGSYVTTDQQACPFTVSSNMFCDSMGCR